MAMNSFRRRSQKQGAMREPLSVAAGILFLVIVGVSVLAQKIPVVVLVYYIGVSVLAFIMYAADKRAAVRGGWRIRESSLQFISLVGGWPGAIVAQQTLRHKSSKQSFRTVLWGIVFLNSGAFAWLFTPQGSATLKTLIEGASQLLLDPGANFPR